MNANVIAPAAYAMANAARLSSGDRCVYIRYSKVFGLSSVEDLPYSFMAGPIHLSDSGYSDLHSY